ncbi:MAG: amino acid adenylation domain-containing protein, partial [Pseudonocardiaceae bacterium]
MRFNSVNPLNPAYVIYTSGSTGVPKGVVVTNESLTNLLADLQDRLPFTSDDRLLAVTTFGFDIAALELLLPLISGGQLIITPGELIDDPRGIGELIADTGATVMQATPALWEGIVTESPEILGRLRILVGGEALTGKLALALRDCAQQVTNVYGPTETTVWSTASRLDNEESARPPIGRPLANTRTYVLDAALRPVPVSIPGELYIAGAGLARGYLGRASLTSERFVANPFGPPGGRMYRTGDLACWRADGELEFLDRVDNQVKIRGFRIELGEIESVLVRHCDVRQAAVTVTQDESGDKRLTAYVVPASGAELDRAELRIYLNRSLPAYMLPSSVITLDELPLTLNGKLDRRALPAPQSGVAVTGRPPRTPHEEILCELFAQLLCLPTVGIDDDFFELGGHSLLATRLVNGIRSRLRIEIPVRTVFEAPTVAALVRRVNGAQSARPALMPVLRPARIPLSFGQRRLWFINRMDSGGATYNIPVALRLTGELDHAALAAALVDLVERHEALRTVFPETSGVPRQCVLGIDDARPALPVTGVDEAGLRAALVAAAVEGFDLTTQPPLRAHLFALTPLEHVLLIVVHHIACDGWSMMPLARDLTSAYAARRRGEPPRWHPLRVQYADYTLWQLAVLGSEDDAGSVISAQARYWNNTLRDLPAELALPLDRPRPRQASFRGSTVEIVLEAPLHERILRLAQRQGVSVFMVLQAALAALCTRLGAGHDIPIGSPISGRMDDALDDMVGFLVNTLVLRTDTSGDPSFVELLARVRETALSAYSNQEMPFEFLVELLNPKRSLSHHPLFQVFLALQNNEAALLDLPGLAMRVEREVLDYAKFDLAFNVREQFVENRVAAGISGVVEYSVDLFDRATIETMVTRLIRFLDTAIANPQHRISAVEVLDGAERRRLLGTWSNQDIPAIAVHERFSQIATARPGSTAVRLGHRVPTYRAPTYRALTYRALTYRELDARANQLAHRLIALGVGPESRVAVFLDRSLDLAVSIVAVLKAGGAYVPLHEAFPAERLEWVMADTAAVVLLTDQATLSRQFQHHAAVIVLDSDPWLGEEPSSDPARPVHPDQLAYVMYTSGSTGTPKGVSISHRDLLALASDPCWNTGNHERVLLHAPYAFDISSYELWVPLLCGGEVVLAPPGRLDAATLARLIEQEKITSVHFTAGLLRVIAEAVPTSLAGVREVLTGGDVVSPVAVERVLEHAPGAVVRQLYGPTEATLCATQHEVRAPQVVGTSIPIGRPLADTRVYVLDAALQPVPPGVIGEIYLAGTGIARGYLNLPTRTAERFLADPCGPVGVRMYRTGDLGRWNSSWQLEFVGRADDQVKIRGFRVEPGEVASVLAGHPDIHEVEVLTRDDHRGERQLIGYVVPDGNRSTDRAAAATRQQIAEWQQIYEGMYAGAPATQFGSDFSGWNSSYNGAPIPVEQMQEWLQSIVDRIRSLRPRRLLEIGVGSGLILSRLAPECETYWATDFSVEAINSLRRELEKRPELDSVVTLRAQPADDFDGLPAGLFDTVVINSVVQYFPNAEYLSTVLRRVLVLLAPGGAVFVGDVRNLNLLRSFHAGVVMAGGAALEDTVSVRRAIDRSVMREKELLVAPEFFHHLCAGDAEIAGVDIAGVDIAGVDIAGVDIRVKRGRHHNELSRYRYDVVLYRAPASGLVSLISAPALRWAADIAGLPSLRAHLEQHRPATLRVVDVPNGRMAHEAAAANAVSAGEPIEQVRHEFGNAAGVDPEIFTELGEQLGYLVGVTWSSAGVNGELDVLLVDATGGTSPAGLCTHDGQLRSVAHTNDPGRFRETSTLSTSLRSYLAKRLPDYMIPAVFVVLDSLPVTVNGKLDREMLPEPELVSEIRGGEPRTPREGTLCALFAQVLGVASVGIDDNFFELGGHSLLAIRLINSIRTAFGAELTVQAVFEAPTVVALVERLDGGTGPAQAPLIPMPRPDPVPLSFAQRRMWFLNRLEEPGGAYNIPALLHLSGPLDRQALDRALQDVVARHESLRTVFPEAGGEPMQLVRDADSLGTGLTIVEITEQELNQALIEACGYGFDLTTEIPCRATLFTLSPTQHVLLVVLHHIAGDGASMGPLARDLGAAYVARASGRDPEFPPLPVQYTDYTLWQRVVLGSEQDPGSRISGQLAYWRATLADLPLELNLPTDRPRPAQVSYRGATLAFELAPALHAGLIRLARERNASLFMVLQAGLAALLTRLGAGTDIPIGSPIAGRTDAALEDLVGFFVNTLVLRTDVSGNPSFGELVERVAARDLKAYANQDVPFELLVEVLNPIRSLARHPLFQVMLALQNNTEDDLVLPDIQVSVPELELAAVKFDLDFDLRERSTGEGTPAGVAGRVGYSTDLFDRATVMLLITRLIKLLEGVAADPTIPIGRIDILDARERQQLLVEWNGIDRDIPPVDVIGLFETQAAATPHHTAITCGPESLTYAQLNHHATHLADHLTHHHHIGPETLVALALPRTPTMIT